MKPETATLGTYVDVTSSSLPLLMHINCIYLAKTLLYCLIYPDPLHKWGKSCTSLIQLLFAHCVSIQLCTRFPIHCNTVQPTFNSTIDGLPLHSTLTCSHPHQRTPNPRSVYYNATNYYQFTHMYGRQAHHVIVSMSTDRLHLDIPSTVR